VQDKLALESSAQSYEDERHDHYCKQSVAGQQREVHGTAPAVSCEVQYSGVGVIVEVAEQKDHEVENAAIIVRLWASILRLSMKRFPVSRSKAAVPFRLR